ncbi:MAG: carboxylating nicotinate-nucleotide diphosphorylase [Candidatus Omnitrophica bacterium]|nr:carboxylating nicotinate-nucleotide diphosphorylase [Candidatus Omnitrophota bacterium]
MLSRAAVEPLIVAALKEDVGPRDVTSLAMIPKGKTAEAEIVVRREGVIAGLTVAEWTFAQVEPKIRFQPTVKDGQKIYADKVVAFLEGPARGILAGERVALNFLGRLSGIATLTQMFVEKVKGTSAVILDTRKTTPTLRALEKYAVAAGGGTNHRMGLYDGILIKDNHLRLVQGLSPKETVPEISPVEQAVRRARAVGGRKPMPVEVEVTSLQEFRQALAACADLILLDNMRLSEIQEAVRLRDAAFRSRPKPLLEVSGGVNLTNVRAVALAGVERISIGALTHSSPWLDVALEVLKR